MRFPAGQRVLPAPHQLFELCPDKPFRDVRDTSRTSRTCPVPLPDRRAGALTVAGERLELFASALEVTPDLLVSDAKLWSLDEGCLYHRNRASTKASTLRRLHARINLLRLYLQRLASDSPFPLRDFTLIPMQVGGMDGPDDAARALRRNLPPGPDRVGHGHRRTGRRVGGAHVAGRSRGRRDEPAPSGRGASVRGQHRRAPRTAALHLGTRDRAHRVRAGARRGRGGDGAAVRQRAAGARRAGEGGPHRSADHACPTASAQGAVADVGRRAAAPRGRPRRDLRFALPDPEHPDVCARVADGRARALGARSPDGRSRAGHSSDQCGGRGGRRRGYGRYDRCQLPLAAR